MLADTTGADADGWRSPVHRDGLALVASSALTCGVGLLYWVVAARLFAPEVLGVNSVAVSTLMLLGSIAQLNMTYALLRFVPVAGHATRRLVLGGYAVGAGAAGLAGTGFAVGAPLWAPQLVDAVGYGPLIAFFALASPVWALFVMQDFVLTAVRRATAVPAANLVFSVLKIVLLAAAAYAAVPGGIAVSWVVATLLVVAGVNAWLLVRALPAHARATADRALPITIGGIARFVQADYAGAVLWQAALFGLPVLVLARLGAEQAAAYGIAWTIAQSLYTVSSGMGQSVVAHTAGDPALVEQARRAMVRRALSLVVPAVATLLVAAPLVLRVFGEHYATHAVGVLVLAALSAVPNVVTASTVTAARVRGRMGVLFGVPATVATLVLVMSWLLMPHLGITAAGLAWLVAQCLVAGGILLVNAPWLPSLLGTHISAVRSAALLRRVHPLAVAQAGFPDPDQWVLGERMTGRSDSVVVGLGHRGEPGGLLKVADSAKGRPQLRRQTVVLEALHADPRLGDWRLKVPRVLGEGDVSGTYAVIESRMPGHPGGRALADPARRRFFVASAISTISDLHDRTATAVEVGEVHLDRWLHEPMAEVVAALPRSLRATARRLERLLADRLRGCRTAVGWTHGDYCPDNVLTDEDGRVTAVVDWCNAMEDGLPVLDVVSFLLNAEVATAHRELGPSLLAHLAESWPRDQELLARAQRQLGGDVVDYPVLLMLGWLQHVGHNLQKSPHFAANPIWMRRNVAAVVRDAERLLGASPDRVPLVPAVAM